MDHGLRNRIVSYQSINYWCLFHVLLTIKSRAEVPLDNPAQEAGTFHMLCLALLRLDT